MEIDQLRDQTCCCMELLAPELGDCSQLVDECLADARKSFRDSFICQFRPEAWAKITFVYHKHFLDTGCDVSVAEIIAEVVRDSIKSNRMDFLTMSLAQHKQFQKTHPDGHGKEAKPCLSVVKSKN
ncbi:MAG: hypothetical protein ACPF9K_01860 [Neptuniibacter sp.]